MKWQLPFVSRKKYDADLRAVGLRAAATRQQMLTKIAPLQRDVIHYENMALLCSMFIATTLEDLDPEGILDDPNSVESGTVAHLNFEMDNGDEVDVLFAANPFMTHFGVRNMWVPIEGSFLYVQHQEDEEAS